jgi:hypothetical protein
MMSCFCFLVFSEWFLLLRMAVVLGGQNYKGCQLNGTLKSPATANEAFECFGEHSAQNFAHC